MPLTPLDIHNKEFGRALRGYREEEVDEFLDLLVREFETLLRENNALRERLQESDKDLRHYRNLEETLNKALLVAQETAREVKANAEKEALLAIRQAEQQGLRIVEEAQARVAKAYTDYDELRRRAQVFRVRMRHFLESQLELFQDADDEGHAPARERPAPAAAKPVVEAVRHWPLEELGGEEAEEPFEEVAPAAEEAGEAIRAAGQEAAAANDLPPPDRPPDPEPDRPPPRRHWLDDLLGEEEDKR